jgi:hypothetical protein
MDNNESSQHRSVLRQGWLAAAGLLLAALVLGGCGGGSKSEPGVASAGSSSSSTSPGAGSSSGISEDQLLKFAHCMRANGIDMPDPKPDGGTVKLGPADGDQTKYDAAVHKCKQFAPAGMGNANDPAAQDRLQKIGDCLRKQGLDVTDTARGPQINGDPSAQKVQAANQYCASHVGHP